MSIVSGVVLQCSLADGDPSYGPIESIIAIEEWLSEHGHGPLVSVEDHSGGSKHPELSIFVAGYNLLNEDAFARHVLSLPWEMPERLVLTIRPQDGPTRIFRPPGF
jgi:hypothetical protein